MNTPTNINWTALIGLIATVIALFGIDVPADVQAKLVAGIDSLTFVIIWVLHTFVNPPPEKRPNMLGFARRHHNWIAAIVLVPIVAAMVLARCGSIPDPFEGKDWQQHVYNSSQTFNALASTGNGLCARIPGCAAARPKLCAAERAFWRLAGPGGAQAIVRDPAKDSDQLQFAINSVSTALTTFLAVAADLGISLLSTPNAGKRAITHDPSPDEWQALNDQVSATVDACGA